MLKSQTCATAIATMAHVGRGGVHDDSQNENRSKERAISGNYSSLHYGDQENLLHADV